MVQILVAVSALVFLVGFPFSLFLPIVVSSSAVPVGGPWQEFMFTTAGEEATGCSSVCEPSPSGNSEYAGTPPWLITAPQSGARLLVVDAAESGDVFDVYDFGALIGSTSAPGADVYCGYDPAVCLENGAMSSGEFALQPGPHEITIVPSATPFNIGAAYFLVTSGEQQRAAR
jgi:hypothetical protein